VALIEWNYIQEIRDLISGWSSGNTTELRESLAAIMQARHDYSDADYNTALPVALRRTTFGFSDDNEVKTTFLTIWKNVYQLRVINDYPNLHLGTSSGFETSRERLALSSLEWNGGKGTFGKILADAIDRGDRAEAWFEIRYNSNANADQGIAKRRYAEAAIFGLYDSGVLSASDAKSIYQMLQLHRHAIEDYDTIYGSQVANAHALISGVGLSGIDAQDLYFELEPARLGFVADLGGQYSGIGGALSAVASTNIFVDPNRDLSGSKNALLGVKTSSHAVSLDASVDSIGTVRNTNDLLVGDGGSDTLIGGNGIDILIGGADSDVLIGGAGADIYAYRDGDGRDTIAGDDNDGSIVFNGQDLSGTWKQAADPSQPIKSWKFAHGGYTFVARMLSGDLVNGATLAIRREGGAANDEIQIQGFKSNGSFGDLGIVLTGTPATVMTIGGTVVNSPWADPNYTGGVNSASVAEGSERSVNWFANLPAGSGYTLKFSLPNGSGDIGLRNGAQVLQFDANGSLIVSLSEGQSALPFTLVSQTDVDVNRSLQLSAQMFDSQGVAVGAASILNVALNAIAEPTSADTVYVVDPAQPFGGTATGVYSGNPYGGAVATHYFSSWNVVANPAYDPNVYTSDRVDMSRGVPATGAAFVTVDGGPGNTYIIGSAYRTVETDGVNVGSQPYNGPTYSAQNGDSDTLFGGAQDDVLQTHGGDDRAFGGAGDDFLIDTPLTSLSQGYGSTAWVDASGHSNLDELHGDAGNDVLVAGAGNAYLDGGADNDQLYAGAGDDTLVGGTGNDLLSGDSRQTGPIYTYGNGALVAGFNIDVYSGQQLLLNTGTTIEDTVNPGADVLDGQDGNDSLTGGGGSDLLWGGNGDDNLQGDTLFSFGGTQGMTSQHGTTPLSLQGNDALYGEAGFDILRGGGGSDLIDGGADDDQIWGDEAPTGAAAVTDQYQGNDTLYGGAGNDFVSGDGGSDAIYGGDGTDQLAGDASSTPDSVQGNDVLDGGAGSDSIIGWGGADSLIGGAGADLLVGDGTAAGGATVTASMQLGDLLDGGDDNDSLYGGGGNDVLIGGAGDDALYGEDSSVPAAAIGNDNLDGGAGNDSMLGGGGADTISGGDGADTIFGDSSDTAPANMGADLVDAGAGNDYVDGGGGNDTLLGSDGSDTIHGGDGDDVLYGGAGNDYLAGEAGDDTYILSESDLLPVGGFIDSIVDTQGDNSIVITGGITTADLTVTSVGGEIQIGSSSSAAKLVVTGLLDGTSGLEQMQLGDGQLISVDQLIGQHYDAEISFNSYGASGTFRGGTQADSLTSTGANSVFSGGWGSDTLTGSSYESDTYRFGSGDGNDLVFDTSTQNPDGTGAKNTLVFTDVDASDVSVQIRNRGEESIVLSNGEGQVTFTQVAGVIGTGTDAVTGPRTLDELVFEDGTVMTWSQLIATNGIDIVGDDVGPATLNGTNYVDRVHGSAAQESIDAGNGNDRVEAAGGNDDIKGGLGSDTLLGGSGDDTYRFNVGDGSDVIAEESGSDTLVFGAGITPGSVHVTQVGQDVVFTIGSNGDSVLVKNWNTTDSSIIDHVNFQDGTSWNVLQVERNRCLAGVLISAGDRAGRNAADYPRSVASTVAA